MNQEANATRNTNHTESHQKSLTNRAWAKYYAMVNLYFDQIKIQNKKVICINCQNILTPKTFVIAKCLCTYCDTCAYLHNPSKTGIRICQCGEKLFV